jgi:ribosomal-protein-alanine N-acetyltransferase
MLDQPGRDVKMVPSVRLVHLNGRHAADLALLAAEEWDVPGFVVRAQRLRARGERETFAVLDAGRLVGVGMLGRDPLNRARVELGYWIGPRERGLGYATAAAGRLVGRAFGPLNATLVFAHCADDNRASARVLARLGFRVASDAAAARESVKRYELTAAEWSVGTGTGC